MHINNLGVQMNVIFIVVRYAAREREWKSGVMSSSGPETVPLIKTYDSWLKLYEIHDEGFVSVKMNWWN